MCFCSPIYVSVAHTIFQPVTLVYIFVCMSEYTCVFVGVFGKKLLKQQKFEHKIKLYLFHDRNIHVRWGIYMATAFVFYIK